MSAFFASGHAVDVVLAVMLIEAVILMARRNSSVMTVAIAFLPGAMIVLAVRAALTGAGWPWVALALAASFPAHLADLRRRGL